MKDKEKKESGLGQLKGDAPEKETSADKAELGEKLRAASYAGAKAGKKAAKPAGQKADDAEQKEPVEKKEPVVADPAIAKMTRQEAIEYFNLPASASKEELDERFWKLGKTYRAQQDEQKLADIALAYSIASGERDRKAEEKKEETEAKHILGKTKTQWKDFFHYEGWKFIVAIAVIIAGWAFIQYYFIAPKVDVRMASIGHFQQDTSIMEYYFKENLGCKNPEVRDADVASGDAENEQVDEYGVQKATNIMAVHPDILVFDAPTVPVYVNSGDLYPLDDVYEKMKETWSKEDLDRLEPYYYSKAKFYEEYLPDMPDTYKDAMEPLKEEDYIEHVYGFIIRDKIDQASLGYKILWKDPNVDRIIIVGVGAGSNDLEKALERTQQILQDIDILREDYLLDHPYAESED
ncbi:MAG: hypothetical protein IKR22_05095 [Clostridiales bacterium]|nr:hypothetical protein [Clostridiales bacterium]